MQSTRIFFYPGLFILKAFTKRYAIPGVRLGYGFCSDREVLDRMEAVTQPWNVSTMAQQAGMVALKESEYVEAGRQIIFRESAWMKEKMRQLGLTVYPSEANYIFFYGPEDLFERCVAKGILIRDCSNYEGLTGDIAYNPQLQRAACVDIRYVLFVIDKYAGAKHLIDELTIVR